MANYNFLLDDPSYAAVIPLFRHEKYQTTYLMVICHQHNCIQNICGEGNAHEHRCLHFCRRLFSLFQIQHDREQDLIQREQV